MLDLFKITTLQQQLKSELPGIEIQQRMSPVQNDVKRYYHTPNHAIPASVLLLLYPEQGEWHTAFVKRSSRSDDAHSGQISLPGGRKDDTDINEMETALRELEEEAGVMKNNVEIIGQLSKLYVYASNHIVVPFVGKLDYKPTFIIQEKEVERIIEVPLSYFHNKKIIKKTNLLIRNYRLENVPYYDLYGEVLWGATAMMFSEFLYLWNKSEV